MAIRFETEIAANNWLNETGHYGRVHADVGGFIILRFDNGGIWAFSSPTKLIALTNW